ncbi:hypothetical protein CL631_01985 [bacterium]|nr:hypothetical protein [bacterium]
MCVDEYEACLSTKWEEFQEQIRSGQFELCVIDCSVRAVTPTRMYPSEAEEALCGMVRKVLEVRDKWSRTKDHTGLNGERLLERFRRRSSRCLCTRRPQQGGNGCGNRIPYGLHTQSCNSMNDGLDRLAQGRREVVIFYILSNLALLSSGG